jgi:hypothetical protein
LEWTGRRQVGFDAVAHHLPIRAALGVKIGHTYSGDAMSAIIDSLLSVGKALFGLRGELAKARKERKEKVADFIDILAQTIDDTAASLRIQQYPGGKCAELFAHSQQLSAAIGDLIGISKADELAVQLQEISEIESYRC